MNTNTLDRLILRIKSAEVLVGQQVIAQQTMSSLTEGSNNEKVNTKHDCPSPSQPHTHQLSKPIEQIKPCDVGACSIHPILKKPQPTQVESHKSTRLLLDTPTGTKITLNPSISPTASMASPTSIPDLATSPTPMLDITTRQAPKKTHLAATRNGRGPRRRPVFNRRKSSQTPLPRTPPITTPPPRRRSEPAAKPEPANERYEDSYVELGLLQHLSFRDEEDQIARDLGHEIAPEPKPANPPVSLFDEDFIEDIVPEVTNKTKASPVPFPRASSLKHPMLSPEDCSRVKHSFDVKDLDLPGGPELASADDVDGDWMDVDAIDSTLPVSQPFKNLVEHRENVADRARAIIQTQVTPAVIPAADKHTPLLPLSMEGVKL